MRITDLIQKTTNEIPCPYDSMQFAILGVQTTAKVAQQQQFFYDFSVEDNGMPQKKRGKFNDDNKQQKRSRLPIFNQGWNFVFVLNWKRTRFSLISIDSQLFHVAFFRIFRSVLVLFVIADGGKASHDYDW